MELLYWEIVIISSSKSELCANFNGEIDNPALSWDIVCNRMSVLVTLTIEQQKFFNCVLNPMYSYKYLGTNGSCKFA